MSTYVCVLRVCVRAFVLLCAYTREIVCVCVCVCVRGEFFFPYRSVKLTNHFPLLRSLKCLELWIPMNPLTWRLDTRATSTSPSFT